MTAEEHAAAIAEAKAEKKQVKREFGKKSVEYAEAREAVRGLKDARDFDYLHGD
jgi:hypothetical protein